MCRIALTTEGIAVAERIAHLQRNGGTLPAEFCSAGGCYVGLNRFTVTSARSPHGDFPLQSERYWLAFNGEVYGFRDQAFIDHPEFISDGHFAMDVLLKFGVQSFLEEADIQGTFLIFDKEKEEWWCAVDQMNTSGGFYATWGQKLIFASESAPIHTVLQEMGINSQVPIQVLEPGKAIRRNKEGELFELFLRPQVEQLFSATTNDDQTFARFIEGFVPSLIEAIRRRIPLEGTVGVLGSGGIDSSVVLAVVAQFLREKNQLNRLKIFTLGEDGEDGLKKNLDLFHVKGLLKALNLEASKYLYIIHPETLEPVKQALFEKYVFSDHPRLITPNPILRSQVRNTVMMSSLLASIKKSHPDIVSLLTGDGSDELLAGYSEMLLAKESGQQVREEIIKRVNFFPLTDGGRVSLAAFYGATAANWVVNPDADLAPVEIRSPFTSHLVMQALGLANPDFLFGKINGVECNKFPLRVMGMSVGVTTDIVVRKKMEFNEGGTGNKNGQPSEVEQAAALNWMKDHCITWDGPELQGIRKLYGFQPDIQEAPNDLTPGLTDQMALVYAAFSSGAMRLFQGKIFQKQPTAPPSDSKSYFPENVRSI
jgi:asparagine synthetase B (glutamine-hydrolysing)